METIEQIKEDEGYRAEVYLCTAGKRTWLYGRNIEDRPITDAEWRLLTDFLTQGRSFKDWAGTLLEIDVTGCVHNLYKMGHAPGEYPSGVSSVLINMIYNMGPTKFNPSKWPKFFAAIEDRDWKLAAAEGRNSLWFYQVGNRSIRLMKSLAAVKAD